MSKEMQKVTQEVADKYKSLPLITSYLPHSFPGGSVLDNMVCRCDACNSAIEMENIRGYVRNPLANLLEFDVLASCMECRGFTDYYLRIRETEDNIRMERIIDGEWTFQFYTNESDINKIGKWLKSFFM